MSQYLEQFTIISFAIQLICAWVTIGSLLYISSIRLGFLYRSSEYVKIASRVMLAAILMLVVFRISSPGNNDTKIVDSTNGDTPSGYKLYVSKSPVPLFHVWYLKANYPSLEKATSARKRYLDKINKRI